MSSTGAGYDYAPTIYSPDGRIFQIEYAQKAIEAGGTSIGVKCKDGVVLANEKLLYSKMLVESSNRAHFPIDLNAGMVTSGYLPDGRQLALRARSVAKQFREAYAIPVIPEQLADQMAQFIHAYTCYYQFRPFGASFMLAAYDENKKETQKPKASQTIWDASAAVSNLPRFVGVRVLGGFVKTRQDANAYDSCNKN